MTAVTQTLRAQSPARIAAGRSVSSERAASCFKRPLTAFEGSERVASATARALAATEQEIVRLKAECTALAARVSALEATLETSKALHTKLREAEVAARDEKIKSLEEEVARLTAANTTQLAEKKKMGEELHSAAMKLPSHLLSAIHRLGVKAQVIEYIETVQKITNEHFRTS